MEDCNSTTPMIKASDYLGLLRQIDTLANLSIAWNDSDQASEPWDIPAIDAIFEELTLNIKRISNSRNLRKNALLCISILNTIIHISTIERFNDIISRDSFQSMFKQLKTTSELFIFDAMDEEDSYSILASEILDSILLNLNKNDLFETCIKRLISNGRLLSKATDTSELVKNIAGDNSINNKTTTIDEKSSEDDRIDYNKIIIIYMSYFGPLAFKAVPRSAYEFKNKYYFLIISLQTFINNYVTDTDNYVAVIPSQIVLNILLLIWNLTDRITLIPMFIDFGLVEKAVQWIRSEVFVSRIENLGPAIFSIIHNLSRDKKGLKKLLMEKTFDILMDCKQLVYETNSNDLTEIFAMTLIALATNDEQSEENKKIFFDAGTALYNGCKKAEQYFNLRYDGLHLSESLELLHRAFSNTYVIKHILDNKPDEGPTPVQYFANLLLGFYGTLLDPEPDELEKHVAEYLLKILLQISSYPDYMKELIEDNEFCIIIEYLAKHCKQDDAKRIWCNIQETTAPNKRRKFRSSDIYVNYDWADEEFCKEFIKELRDKTSIPIWVDYENVELNDDMWEHSSSVINSAIVIIVLVSTAYAENTNKFQELSYIVATHNRSKNKQKSLIVVEAEPDFSFHRRWMSDLLDAETRISYESNIRKMASKVYKEMTVSKKSTVKCFSCRRTNIRKRNIEHDNSSTNGETLVLKSILDDSNPVSTQTYVQKKSPSTTNESDVLISITTQDIEPIINRPILEIRSVVSSIKS